MDLIERLEKATGPDRDLDAEILRALVPDVKIALYCVGDEEPICFGGEPFVCNRGEVPAYTEDVNAAVALVPEGFGWNVGMPLPKFMQRYWAGVFREKTKEERDSGDIHAGCFYQHGPKRGPTLKAEEYASTPAIALCIAALKARAA